MKNAMSKMIQESRSGKIQISTTAREAKLAIEKRITGDFLSKRKNLNVISLITLWILLNVLPFLLFLNDYSFRFFHC